MAHSALPMKMSWREWTELHNDLTQSGVKMIEEECVQHYLDRHTTCSRR